MFDIYDQDEFSAEQDRGDRERAGRAGSRRRQRSLARQQLRTRRVSPIALAFEDFRSPELNPVMRRGMPRRGHAVGAWRNTSISRKTGDILIVLHQMGSHGPAYYKRYPEAFRVFLPDLRHQPARQLQRRRDRQRLRQHDPVHRPFPGPGHRTAARLRRSLRDRHAVCQRPRRVARRVRRLPARPALLAGAGRPDPSAGHHVVRPQLPRRRRDRHAAAARRAAVA